MSLLADSPAVAPGNFLSVAVLLAAVYVGYVLWIMSQMSKADGARPAAPFELGSRELADIQWGSAALVTFGYCFLVFVFVRWMERRNPVRSVIIFEIMAVYNSTQVLLNVYEAGMQTWRRSFRGQEGTTATKTQVIVINGHVGQGIHLGW